MAKASRSRLKVYQAPFGFYDSVVAAPSQAAALRAWGSRQNLFAEGLAQVSSDPQAAVALEHPGTPLRRAIGSKGPFSLDPDLPDVPAVRPRRPPAARAAEKPAAKPAPAKPPPDRRALDAVAARLQRIDAARVKDEAELRQAREALEARDEESRRRWSSARAKAEADLAREEAAFRRAGGA